MSTMKNTKQMRSFCPVNYALETFGDVWSLLIVRDSMLFGKTTYNEFLASSEKIATNILANRLDTLVRNGIFTKKRHPSDKRKDIYQLTTKGKDLYPIMKEIMLWSKKYDKETALPDELAEVLRTEIQPVAEQAFHAALSINK